MIILTVVVTATYTAVLIPFKGLVLVPGFTEVRLANVLPVVFSVLFGPAAAWGSAFGNLIGDVFGGTLTRGSVFGFVGNFFFGFAGYKLWGNLGRLSCDEEPAMDSAGQLLEFLAISFVSAAGTAAIIAWGLEVLQLLPFSVLGTIIFVNDFLVAAIGGPILLRFLYPRVKRDGLLYPDLMREGDLPSVSERRQQVAGIGIAAVSIAWIVVGIGISLGLQGVPFGVGPADVTASDVTRTRIQLFVGSVAALLLLVASLLSGERLSAILRRDD
ncbi:energy-coupling factor transport system substrate-specific component [Halomicrobium zhouii]|uniref:Energy-coupling factor transport system substrate-specific component n=2 Tax=Halomicrobium zhouii TaxID=767519 RepID=A0A1I6KTL0_9EURY|nr:energy-coupling factor transport system substrate-specific component [Halomicrobium zhouii]